MAQQEVGDGRKQGACHIAQTSLQQVQHSMQGRDLGGEVSALQTLLHDPRHLLCCCHILRRQT